MKWLFICVWLVSILFFYFRGKIKPTFGKTFIDHSVILAPLNALLILCSEKKFRSGPFISKEHFSNMELITENWRVTRDEACGLLEQGQIKKTEKNNDVGFTSFFKYGWKRFCLKWYGFEYPSALASCPRSVAILKKVKCIKAAMFAELPPKGKLNPHRDPFEGSLRYYLGLSTPNSEKCYIDVDGQRYWWKDGESMIFDETFVHEARNDAEKTRLILFCDIARLQKNHHLQSIAEWISVKVMSAAVSPNTPADKTGFINRLSTIYWTYDNNRKKLKAWSKNVYLITKWMLLLEVIFCLTFFL